MIDCSTVIAGAILSQHQQKFSSVVPGLTGAWDLQGVSDSYYFTDLNSSLAAMSQSYLPRTGRVNYAAPSWNASVVAQGYQTLNFNPSAQVATPYQMLPQVNFAMNRSLLGAAGFSNVRLNDQDELEVIQSTGMFDQPARLGWHHDGKLDLLYQPGLSYHDHELGLPAALRVR